MTNVSRNAFAHEPGVHQFSLLTPRNVSVDNATSLYSFERYQDAAAFQSHLNTTVVKDMFAWINSASIYQTTPTVHQLGPPEQAPEQTKTDNTSFPDRISLEYIDPSLASAVDPFVVVRQIDYTGAAAATASLSFWKTAVAIAKDDGCQDGGKSKKTLAYSVFASTDQGGRIFTFAAYADEAAYHQDRDPKGIETGIVDSMTLFLKVRGGFLYKTPA